MTLLCTEHELCGPYLLTPWSRVLLQKLTVNIALVKNYVGLTVRNPVLSFMRFKGFVYVSHRIEFRMPNVPGFFKVI
jgi:hypothetical protein